MRAGTQLLLAMCCTPLLTACSALRPDEAEINPATVVVGGLIRQPQAIALDKRPMTIREAVALAGGLDRANIDTSDDAVLVALQRPAGITRTVHYMPLALLEQSLAGEMLLHDDDSVRLISWKETSLGPLVRQPPPAVADEASEDPSDSYEILVTGRVQRPGRHRTQSGVQELLRIGDVYGHAGALGPEQKPATVVLLRRPAASGLAAEVFLLPLDDGPYGALAPTGVFDQFLLPGDRLEYTRLELVPLVLQSLAQRAVHRRSERTGRRIRRQQQFFGADTIGSLLPTLLRPDRRGPGTLDIGGGLWPVTARPMNR